MVFPVKGRASGGEAKRRSHETSDGGAGDVEVEELSAELPDDGDTVIAAELFVGRNDWNLFVQRLGDELTIKGVAVMSRQFKHTKSVICSERQDVNIHIFDCLARIF